jgi:adenylate cyclase
MNLSSLPKVPLSVLALAVLAVAGVYLFATRPPELADVSHAGRQVSAEELLRLLDAENAAVRALYASEIVGPGQKQGLKFREDWRSAEVHAGPLPALLLRETASRLQRRVPDLSLFLGSNYPIEASNHFSGAQLEYFSALERTGKPQFFKDASTGRYTAMFADLASAASCVTCHNEHPRSPRTDWKLNDVMGATTWSFARESVSVDEALAMLAAYRAAALESYEAYLKKIDAFPQELRPTVGESWPKEGLHLPNLATFRAQVEARNSTKTLNALLLASAQAR